MRKQSDINTNVVYFVLAYLITFDMLSVSKAGGASAPAVMSAVVWVLAVVMVIVFQPANLSRLEIIP
ncbi:MAG: hypothetical protein ACYTBS_25855 [Planctomycetota bacterium]|jgi:hypothetical protein